MDIERAFISRILLSGEIANAMKRKVTADYFFDARCKKAFEWTKARYEEGGGAASMQIVQETFDLEPEDTGDSFITLLERMRARKIYTDIQRSLKSVVDIGREDPFKALAEFQKLAAKLSADFDECSDLDANGDMATVMSVYERARELKGMLGVPWPWPAADALTKGMRPGQLIAMYGKPGTMKTWLLLWIAYNMCKFSKKKPIFFTYEMPKEDILYRYAALVSGVDYGRFQAGCLNKAEEDRFFDTVDLSSRELPFIICELEEGGKSSLGSIQAKIEEYKADVALIDGLSFVTSGLDWESFGATIMQLKFLAKRLRIPIIATHHANRLRGKANKESDDAKDVALGDILQRQVDVLIRVVRDAEEKENKEIKLNFLKVREGESGNIVINGKPAYDFTEKYVPDDEPWEHDTKSTGYDEGVL